MRSFIIILTVLLLLGAGFSFSPYAPWANKISLDLIQNIGDEDKAPEKTFNASRMTLENGLEVIVVPNNRAPVVTHMVWYKAGAADELPGRSGIAHFLEHLMFKGSSVIGGEDLAPGEFSRIVRRAGGNDNAFTGQDYTAYFQSVPADQLEQVMRMEAGRMKAMLAPPEEVLSERQVILEERRQRTDNDPRGRFGEQIAANAFINHPYGTPVIGWAHEMEVLDRDYALEFHRKWYAPNNAVLVVAGDVDPYTVFALAKQTYGTLERRDTPKRVRTRSPIFHSQSRVILKDGAIREPSLQILYRVPSHRQDAGKSYAFEVLEEIMAGGPASRLYKSLVSEQQIATSIGMSYRSDAWDDSQLWVYANPAPGVSLDDLEQAIYAELTTLLSEGVSEEELREAVTRLQDSAIYARDSLSGPAMIIGSALATGSTLDDVEYWPARIEAVTAQHVQEVAKEYLNPNFMTDTPPVVGILLPKDDRRPPPAPAIEETDAQDETVEETLEEQTEGEVRDEE